jgi:hypothetical protein
MIKVNKIEIDGSYIGMSGSAPLAKRGMGLSSCGKINWKTKKKTVRNFEAGTGLNITHDKRKRRRL